MKKWKVLVMVIMVIGWCFSLDAADFDGDGTNDIGVFRPSAGLWAIRGVTRVYFGGSGDDPVPGDYNGDGVVDIGLFRPSAGLWAVKDVTRAYFGGSSDEPIPVAGGDYWSKSGVNNIIYGGNIIAEGSGGFNSLGDEGIAYLGDTSNYIKAAWGIGLKLGTYGADDVVTIRSTSGSVGIGMVPTGAASTLKRPLWINGLTLWYDVELSGGGEFPDSGDVPDRYSGIFCGDHELWAIDDAGNSTQLTSHDDKTGEWIFLSRNVKTGREVRVNMEKLVHLVEELSGEKLLEEKWN